ncbi:MAG: response regulator transcription factor [Bacteroidota bacterium]
MHEILHKILLVEDDLNFGAVMQSYLKMNNYFVAWVSDGKKAIPEFNYSKFDLCILDVMLPNIDGFTIAKEIRLINSDVPIIFLTAKTLKKDIIEGFRSGADDYITKPFDSELLLLKISAILKRNQRATTSKKELQECKIGRFNFNYAKRFLESEGHQQKLSPKEAELLRLLCENMNNVLDRNKALIKIWGEDGFFTTRSMDVYITKLRNYMKNDSRIEIKNIHGSGFVLYVHD